MLKFIKAVKHANETWDENKTEIDQYYDILVQLRNFCRHLGAKFAVAFD